MIKTRRYYVFIAIVLFAFSINSLNAQIITTDPPFPQADDSLTITFDASQGNAALAGNTTSIYAHTGVNDWAHVIGAWGNNANQPKMTRISADIYTLKIVPSIREFYGAAADEEILQMAFVFRDSTGSPQSEDIMVDIYDSTLHVKIISPDSGAIVEQTDTISVYAAASAADSIFLYLDDNLIASASGKSIRSDVIAEGSGAQWLKVIVKSGLETLSDSTYFYVISSPFIAELPDSVIQGINYINDSTVTLVLHDPPASKKYVFVLGDFNNWSVGDDYFMNRTADSTYFWLTIENLEKGKEYIFQYAIDGELHLADPYTEKVSDPWHDKWITNTIYPDLIDYPEGKAEGIASVLQTGQTPYAWEVTDFQAPAIEDLVIYELLIRDFVSSDDIKDVIDTLGYLERLGVNAIELMPINEFEGNDSWGYNPSFYFAADKAYGTKQDYQRFVDECHKRGIAVIIDMVLNHSFGQSPLVQMYFDASAGEWGQPAANNPWYNETCPHEPWCWGYDFDHGSEHMKEFMDRVNAYWLTEYNVDGFRFDFTKGFSNTYSDDGWSYNSERIDNLKRMSDAMWSVNPSAYVILEHLTTNSEEKELADYGMMLWGNMNYSYNEATMGWGGDFSLGSYKSRGWSNPNLITYMESHDEERLMYKNIAYGDDSTGGWYNVRDTNVAVMRIEEAAVFFFTIPGPKMIWQFGELGYDYSINYCSNGTIKDDCRTGRKPVPWAYLNDNRRAKVYQTFSSLIHLKKEHDVFRTEDFSLSLAGTMKRIVLNDDSMNVVVLGNFGVESDSISPQFPHTGWWADFFSGDSIYVTDVNAYINFIPGEYRLYTDMNLVGVEEFASQHTAECSLKAIPNWENDNLTIEFSLPENNKITLEIYNLQGEILASLPEREYEKGNHSIGYSGMSQFASGLYIVRMIAGNQAISQKFIKP